LEYTKGFLKGSNEESWEIKRFVENAPEQVVQKEYTKKADAEAKIKAIEEQLKTLKQ
jgi:valyl-tRNA synthetase